VVGAPLKKLNLKSWRLGDRHVLHIAPSQRDRFGRGILIQTPKPSKLPSRTSAVARNSRASTTASGQSRHSEGGVRRSLPVYISREGRHVSKVPNPPRLTVCLEVPSENEAPISQDVSSDRGSGAASAGVTTNRNNVDRRTFGQCAETRSRFAMTIRVTLVGAYLLVFAIAPPALAAGGCGGGCHTTPAGVCVRDGWQEGLPVRNECPATSRPQPPCSYKYRWSRQAMMCVER
jgi:hypothetical protein